MKKSVYLSLLLLTGAAFQAQAVPAIPTPFSIGQPDGTTVTVTLSGMSNFEQLKENIDTGTPAGKLLFTLMSAIAQFERDTIADRTREGLRAARARGRMGGRPKTDTDIIKKAVKLYRTGQYSIKEIEELTGIRKSTLYRNLQEDANDER